jgi:hypothetical protein
VLAQTSHPETNIGTVPKCRAWLKMWSNATCARKCPFNKVFLYKNTIYRMIDFLFCFYQFFTVQPNKIIYTYTYRHPVFCPPPLPPPPHVSRPNSPLLQSRNTPLHVAALNVKGNTGIVQALIAAKASIEAKDEVRGVERRSAAGGRSSREGWHKHRIQKPTSALSQSVEHC